MAIMEGLRSGRDRHEGSIKHHRGRGRIRRGKPLQAPEEEIRKEKKPVEKQRVYKVWIWQETKDCLWNIAKKYYGDPHKWQLIYEANRDIIDDPRLIYPKQRLVIPFLIDEEIRE